VQVCDFDNTEYVRNKQRNGVHMISLSLFLEVLKIWHIDSDSVMLNFAILFVLPRHALREIQDPRLYVRSRSSALTLDQGARG
jgi:hypothetical protein